jgi:HAMP domain-containing protein
MKAWLWFWTASLLVAGSAFAYITAVVTVRGLRDLLDMFRALAQQPPQHRNTPHEP